LRQSFQGVNSFGEWLIPPIEGTKIIPVGNKSAKDWVIEHWIYIGFTPVRSTKEETSMGINGS